MEFRFKKIKMLFAVGVFFCCRVTAEPLTGKVICTQSGKPVDSVRITSISSGATAYSGKDGAFLLALGDDFQCRPDSQIIAEFDEYSVKTARSPDRPLLRNEVDGDIHVRLIDLRGRVAAQWKGHLDDGYTRLFPDGMLSNGIYLMSTEKMAPERVLFTGKDRTGFITCKRKKDVSVIYPYCPTDDTVCFCRNGYESVRIPLSELYSGSVTGLAEKKWIASDFHNHTVLTDGEFILDSVLTHAFGEGGLDVVVNSEHGGMQPRDTAGRYFTDIPPANFIAQQMLEHSSLIPRWFSLKQYAWPKLTGQRTHYPDKLLLLGLEWNCPGHEHASVGVISDAEQPYAVGEFEYRFDFQDTDTSLGIVRKQNAYVHANACTALEWLERNYPSTSYCVVNHPSREAIGPYRVEHFRDFHTVAPHVCIGFEGIPGHHKKLYRGSYSYSKSTWGGADGTLAEVGGIWDALLGEGRHFWTFVNSDFHNDYNDHWPGVYTKTWSTVTDTGAREWLDGLRSGEVFIVMGDLVSQLEFHIDDGIYRAAMGEEFTSRSAEVELSIRFRSPSKNNHGDQVTVDHIDVIAGTISGPVSRQDTGAYTSPFNRSATVVRRFGADDWEECDGWNCITTSVTIPQSTYFRLRGTNNAVGTPGEVDNNGNPMIDQPYTNTEAVAWKDLWFYSNPIFVYR